MTEPALLAALPEVFRTAQPASAPLSALVAAGEEMHRPVERVLDGLDAVVDPFRSPEGVLGYLAGWVDLHWLTVPDAQVVARCGLPGGSGPLRDLLAASADLSARRGTAAALVRFLEIATHTRGYAVASEAGQFHIRVSAPAGADLALVQRIVTALKPAHVTADVVEARGNDDPTPTQVFPQIGSLGQPGTEPS